MMEVLANTTLVIFCNICVYQIDMLYNLKLHNVIYQLYHNKMGKNPDGLYKLR